MPVWKGFVISSRNGAGLNVRRERFEFGTIDQTTVTFLEFADHLVAHSAMLSLIRCVGLGTLSIIHKGVENAKIRSQVNS
jgi:hypothetical protein